MDAGQIVEIEKKEYLVFQKLEWNKNVYYVICPIEGGSPTNDGLVVKERDGMFYSIEDEDEEKEVLRLLEEGR